ncbi:protein of unknown function [Legionella fallonii LLAP-10]|uniref:Uncharacterized protein n=1 Tax=Legionella fallonii LLAP-10 TaxID=1212491 RepID=A0A098G0K0_9GAMM|nr:protein of unknown function [Legionella fallonii LLAP-10]
MGFEKVDLGAFEPVKHLICGSSTLVVNQDEQLVKWSFDPWGISGLRLQKLSSIALPKDANSILNIFYVRATFDARILSDGQGPSPRLRPNYFSIN